MTQDAADRLRAEHPGEQVYFGYSFNWDGPPTHSTAEAFLGVGPDPGPGAGAPVLWIRTKGTPWIRADEPLPCKPVGRTSRTRRASVAELKRRVATAERKTAEAAARLASARDVLTEHPDYEEDGTPGPTVLRCVAAPGIDIVCGPDWFEHVILRSDCVCGTAYIWRAETDGRWVAAWLAEHANCERKEA